jgi:hypothetical protein
MIIPNLGPEFFTNDLGLIDTFRRVEMRSSSDALTNDSSSQPGCL